MAVKSYLAVVFLCYFVHLSSFQASAKDPLESYELVYTWKEVDFAFPSPEIRDEYILNGKFIRENNVITGLKVTRDRAYLTVPRWRTGVPATLVSLPYSPSSPLKVDKEVSDGPLLVPYPSWEMNELGNCTAFQYIQSMEIDQFNRMWIIDVGRVNIFETPNTTCPPKLVLMDLATSEVILSYTFPDDVVSYTKNFLNDIVVGCNTKDDCYAYMSDAGEGKIIIFNLAERRSWFASHPTMLADPQATNITLEGQVYIFDTPIDGIALSQKDKNFDRVYFTPLSSFELYSVTSAKLKSFGVGGAAGEELSNDDITFHGSKSSQTDGMSIDANGGLTFGLLGENAVNYWNTSYGNMTEANQILLIQSDIDLAWADTFSIDEYGYLFATTNKLHRFTTNTYDFETTNFRVVRSYLGIKSYMFSASDPVLPVANAKTVS